MIDPNVQTALIIAVLAAGAMILIADIVIAIVWFTRGGSGNATPFARRWSVVDVFMGGQLALIGMVVLVVIAMLCVVASGSDPMAIMLPMTAPKLLWMMLMQDVPLLVAPLLYFRYRYRLGLRDLGMTRCNLRRGVWLGFLWSIPTIAGSFGLENLSRLLADRWLSHKLVESFEQIQAQSMMAPLLQHMDAEKFAIMFFIIAIIAPFIEEIFFRGFLQNAVRIRWGVPTSIVVSTIVFAAIHMPMQFIFVYLYLSVMLALCYVRSKTLIASMTLHFLNNAFVVVLAAMGLAKP